MDELETMQQYSFVVLLKLREKQIQNCKNLSEVLNYPTDPTLGQAVVDGILEGEGVQCVGSPEVYAIQMTSLQKGDWSQQL